MAGCPNGQLSQWLAVPMAGCQLFNSRKDWTAPKIGQPQRLDSPKDRTAPKIGQAQDKITQRLDQHRLDITPDWTN
jgi:hypothetical protein